MKITTTAAAEINKQENHKNKTTLSLGLKIC